MITLNVEYQKEKPILMSIYYTTSRGYVENLSGFFNSIQDAFFYAKDRRDYVNIIKIRPNNSTKVYEYEKVRGFWMHEGKTI